jgi:hypothetical protein
MNRPSLAAHEAFACQAVDCLAKLADADGDEIRRVVPALAAAICEEAIARAGLSFSDSERHWMAERVLDEAFGSGPLEPLLRDETTDAVVILGPRDVCLERDGQLTETAVVFADDQHIRRTFERRIGIERYLERVPGEGGPTWRLDLRKLRQRMAQAAKGDTAMPAASAAAPTASPVPAPPRQAGGIARWLAKIFG